MEREICCENCGGSYDNELTACPYCGTIHIKAAEKEYMEKLESVREKMEDLEDTATEELQNAVKKQVGRIWKILLCVGAVFLIAVLVHFFSERSQEWDYKAQYLWQQENYPRLDALYDDGRYDELEQLVNELSEEENSNLADWKHFYFLSDYTLAKSVQSYMEQAEETPNDLYVLVSLFDIEWAIKGMNQRKEEYSEEEYEALLPFVEVSEADLEDRWKLTEEEFNSFFEELKGNNFRYISYSRIQEFMKVWIKENR